MIMGKGQQQLLLPVNPAFLWGSLTVALLLDLLPIGRAVWAPDPLLLLLVFWAVHQPARVGMGVAFLLGLCMDVDRSSLLGQHALAYALLVFAAGAMSRRLSWFSTPVQALHLLPLFAVVHGLQVLLRMVAGGIVPGPLVVVAPLIEALLWPLVSGLLLAPQRRPPDSDENRPL